MSDPENPSSDAGATLFCVLSDRPGPCSRCRHANQDTVDFREGVLACRLTGSVPKNATCNVAVANRTTKELAGFAYYPFDGTNCTWLHQGSIHLMPKSTVLA